MAKVGVLASGISRRRWPIGEHRETKLFEIAPEAHKLFPFYVALPYDNPIALLKWRVYVRKRCVHDLSFRAAVWEMCRRDVAFFAVTFVFISEPRPLPRRLPFHLWTDQVSVLAWLTEIFGERPAGVNKTRGIGVSWMFALFVYHKWLFVSDCKLAVLTQDKDKLDGPDENSLIGKFQYIFNNMPEWAKFTTSGGSALHRLTEKLTFINVCNRAVIQGFVSTTTKLRQFRFTMIFADEYDFWDRTEQEEWLVSAGGCTDCLVFASTWNNFEGAFHRLMHEEESSLLKISMFWWNNYERWQGAYNIESGRVNLIDPNYKHPDGYEFGMPDFIEEGMIRSPWVDSELSKPGIDRLKTLRDLYGMAVCQRTNSFFSAEMRQAVKQSERDPEVLGLLDVSSGVVKIHPTLKGDIRTWGGIPLRDRGPYVAFSDLSQGVGAAYSVMCVFDRGGEQVLEYGTNKTDITAFAYNCVMIARWLAGDNGDGHVLLDFEGGGGQQAKPYAAELLRMQYGNIHKSEVRSNTIRRVGEVPTYYGTVNRDSGFANFQELQRAVLAMEAVIRSAHISNDLRLCGKDKDGRPSFPTGRREGHGDFAHAAGGGWWRSKTIATLENRAELEGNSNREQTTMAFDMPENKRLWSEYWSAR